MYSYCIKKEKRIFFNDKYLIITSLFKSSSSSFIFYFYFFIFLKKIFITLKKVKDK